MFTFAYLHMGVSRLFRCRGFIPGPLCKRDPMGPKGPMGPWGPRGPWGPWGPMVPVYVAFTQRCWGKGTNEKRPYLNPSCFGGQVLSFLMCCVFFRVFQSRSLQKRSGTCLNASGMFFASSFHMEIGKTITKSIRSEYFGILQLWEFFCQPFGENIFRKTDPKRKSKSLRYFA